jgi:hypothetical protein
MMAAMRRNARVLVFVALTLVGAYLAIGVALALLTFPNLFMDSRVGVFDKLALLLMWPLWMGRGTYTITR